MSNETSRLLQNALSLARNHRAYAVWRRFREAQQLKRVADVLETLPADAQPYSECLLLERLASSAQARLGWIDRPGVLGYGRRDWEDKGLWKSLARVSDFSLFDWGTLDRNLDKDELRIDAKRQFLSAIEARESEGRPVQIAFFYAGSDDVDLSLMAQLRAKRIWTVVMGLDDKQQFQADISSTVAADQLSLAQAVDVYWTTWRTGADWLLSKGANPWFAPPAADPEFFHPVETLRDIDVLWLGRAYGPRTELVRFLRERGIPVTTYGPGWASGMVDFEEMIRLFSRAKVVLGMGGVGQTDQFKHLKGRDFEVPMTGSLYLTSFNPELTDHYQVGDEILCYSSPIEALDVLRWILPRPAEAAVIRGRAIARCLRDHTWQRRFEKLFGLMHASK